MSTTNPVMIMVINMTIVFAVLYVLSLCIKFIYVIDPTKKKKKKRVPAAPKPKKVEKPADDYQDKLDIAIISAALVAYGCKNFTITSIRKIN